MDNGESMTGDFIPWERSSGRENRDLRMRQGTMDCFYLGSMIPMAPENCGSRIGGIGELYCIMMRRLPCPENCPDRKAKEKRVLFVEEPAGSHPPPL